MNKPKNRRDSRWHKAAAAEPREHLTRQTPPQRKWRTRKITPCATGEKTRRGGCRSQTAAPGLSPIDALEPPAGHAPRFVELSHHIKELLLRNPATGVDDSPEDAEFFQSEVQTDEGGGFVRLGSVSGLDAKLHSIEHEAVHALPEGEARVFRYVRRPV